MKLRDVAQKLHLSVLTPELESRLSCDVAQGHVSDLLSDVLANAPGGGLLVTIQLHMNVIAVASHAGLSGVVFAAGRAPEEPVRRKAVEE
ncbi:MAG: serine kinase, partial [Planctomycetota bacterium]